MGTAKVVATSVNLTLKLGSMRHEIGNHCCISISPRRMDTESCRNEFGSFGVRTLELEHEIRS
jgi:hypothetical protein